MIKESIHNLDELIMYMNLCGFKLSELMLSTTTPLYLATVPKFSYSIPTIFMPDEDEDYAFPGVVSFMPPSNLLLTGPQGEKYHVTSSHLLTWQPGDDIWVIQGEHRRMTVKGKDIQITIPTITNDLVLPLGVIAANVDCGVEGDIKRIGVGITSWVPKKIYARRRGLPVILEWKDPNYLNNFDFIDKASINTVLLGELSDLVRVDNASRRVEAILWEDMIGIDRFSFRFLPRGEKEAFFTSAEMDVINRDDVLLSCSSARTAQTQYEDLLLYRKRWRGL